MSLSGTAFVGSPPTGWRGWSAPPHPGAEPSCPPDGAVGARVSPLPPPPPRPRPDPGASIGAPPPWRLPPVAPPNAPLPPPRVDGASGGGVAVGGAPPAGGAGGPPPAPRPPLSVRLPSASILI